jgi:hypothetical protein
MANPQIAAQITKPRGEPLGSPLTLHDQSAPPAIGPRKRINDTMLCATPFAIPTRCGGDTTNHHQL